MRSRLPIVFLTAFSLLLWLLGFPPEWINSWWGIFPLSLLFLSFCGGMLGWGLLCAEPLGGGGAEAWLFSSVAAVAFAFAAGHLGLLHHSWLFLLFLHLGILFAPWRSARKELRLFSNFWLIALLIFIFGLRYLTAYLPQGHGDPLLYHLMGPRLWARAGAVHLNPDLPVPLLAATWEYFYLWPQVLFVSEPASVVQLATAQVFSQWIHLIWGLLGSLYVLRALVKGRVWFSGELPWALLFLALLFVPSMQWTAALAKNDCGMAFWCLGAWLFFSRGIVRGGWFAWLLGGFFAGLAVSAKISAILFFLPLIPVLIVQVWRIGGTSGERASRLGRAFFLALAGSFLGAGPVYLRNWLETKNPFYTMFSRWFPGPWVSQTWADHFNTHQPSGGLSWLHMVGLRFHQLLHETPILWLWALLPLLLFRKKSREALKEWWDWIAIFFLAYVLMVVAVMHDAELRYLGASLWVAAVLGVVFWLVFFEEFFPKRKFAGEMVLLLALLGVSKLPTHFLWKFFRTRPGETFVLTHTAGEAKAWLRAHADGRLVLLYGDNETYYLSTLRAAVVTERPDIDRATYQKTDLADFIKGICESSGASLLLDSRPGIGLAIRFSAGPWNEAVLFENAGARVYDLKRLQDLVLKGDYGCGRT